MPSPPTILPVSSRPATPNGFAGARGSSSMWPGASAICTKTSTIPAPASQPTAQRREGTLPVGNSSRR
jgi:hypothetical protein